MSNHKENVIREKRTIEATKKNLMGPAGKLGQILQAFGSPIIRQGSGLMDAGFLDDPYDDLVHTEYSPTMSGQQGPVSYRDELLAPDSHEQYTEGQIFDGLSRGLHLEIVFRAVDNELTVRYKGYVVYKEVAGELDAYGPFPEWEDMIDRLYKSAKEKLKTVKKQLEVEIGQKIEEKKRSFWRDLRLRWGI